VNAELIGTYRRAVDITFLTAVSSNDDFDYMVGCDVSGSLFVMDVFQRKAVDRIAQLPWPLQFVAYIRETDSLFAVSSLGQSLVITNPFEQFISSEF
jgi:hypothetical protein